MTTTPQAELLVGTGVNIEIDDAGNVLVSATPVDNDARVSAQAANEAVAELSERVPATYQTHQVILWDATVADTDKYAPRDGLYAYAHYIGPTDPSSVGRPLDDGDLWTNNA